MQPLAPSQKASLERAAAAYRLQLTPELRGYLAERGFSDETIDDARFGQACEVLSGHDYLQGRLVIPYIGPAGNIYNLRFRCMEHVDCKEAGCGSKYMSLPGFPSRVFNVRALVTAETAIHVTEGELDAVSLNACGMPAIGIPGVENMPAHLPRMLAGFSSVYMWCDGDQAGRDLAARFSKAIPMSTVLHMSAGDDVNSVYAREGEAGLLRILSASLEQ